MLINIIWYLLVNKEEEVNPIRKEHEFDELVCNLFWMYFFIIFLLLIKQKEGPSIGTQTTLLTPEKIEVNYELLNNS